MTDAETISRLQEELDVRGVQLKSMFVRCTELKKKVKNQRVENSRLNDVVSELNSERDRLKDELKWIKGD